MPQHTYTVPVDEELLWVLTRPAVPAGTARPCSPEQAADLCRQFDAWSEQLGGGEGRDLLIHTVAFTVLETLREPPELPFIGEPFGGTEGTD